MFASTRRDVLISAAGAAAFGLSRPLRIIPSTLAGEARERGFFRYRIGEITCTSLYDGIWRKEHYAAFIRNATVEETRRALAAAGLPTDHVPIEFTQTLLEIGDRTVLIDPGTGGQWVPTAGAMMRNLQDAGFGPRSVDVILISHFHPDHIFGLMEEGTDEQIFPVSEILVPQAEYDFWTDAAVFTRLPEAWHGLARRIQATLATWPNVSRFTGEREVVPGVRSLAAYGHTPGHTAFHVGSGDQELIVAGDTAITPALFLAHPDWQVAFDADPELAERTRRRLFDRIIAHGAVVAGYHFGFLNAGTISRDGSGYTLDPIGG